MPSRHQVSFNVPEEDTEKIGKKYSQKCGTLPELMSLDHKYDRHGKLCITPNLDRFDAGNDPEYSEHVLVFHRMFNNKHELETTKITINSSHILNCLEDIVEYYPCHPMYFNQPLTLKGPYMLLCHYWGEIEAYKDNTVIDEQRMHINLLLQFMERELGTDRRKALQLTQVGHISFTLLWTIFKPGIPLIQRSAGGDIRMYRLKGIEYKKDYDKMEHFLQLTVSSCKYDGTLTGRYDSFIKIYESEVGQAAVIDKLSIYPFCFAEHRDRMIEQLKTRGEQYLSLRGIHVQRYHGPLSYLRMPPHMYFAPELEKYAGSFTPETMEGRIVVDTKTFMEENPFHCPKIYDHGTPGVAAHHIGPKHTQPPWGAQDPVLFPPYVYGFSPSLKEWCKFNIDQIGDPEWAEDAFDGLILDPAPKRVIRSLVTAHEFPNGVGRDRQGLKGKGLVFLLHGTPGTGKTLTAEAVAEHTKRALIVVSSGELGQYVDEIEESLTKLLEYASTWKAIVLLDEADVFLEARLTSGSNRLEQNRLVAVFLRQLEYFQGIVFLTTNRSSGFDTALESRIHLSLQFFAPDLNRRRALWQQIIRQVPMSELDFEVETAIDTLSVLELNGREIANAWHVIRTLAKEDGTRINDEHIRACLQLRDGVGSSKIAQGRCCKVLTFVFFGLCFFGLLVAFKHSAGLGLVGLVDSVLYSLNEKALRFLPTTTVRW